MVKSSEMIRLEAALKADEAMQARLQELADAYEGDKADEEAYFAATIGTLAMEA